MKTLSTHPIFGLKHAIYDTGGKKDYMFDDDTPQGAEELARPGFVYTIPYQYKYQGQELHHNIKIIMSTNMFKAFFIFLNIYSCGQNIQSKDCFDLNNKSYKYLDSDGLLDSAYYYNEQAYICNPYSKRILKTRYTIFKKKKDFINTIKTLDDLINLKDSITEKEKNWHRFAKAVIYMSIDEVKYSDSLKANYIYVNSKFDRLKLTAKSRDDFEGIFDHKVLYTYYYKGKINAKDIINMYPSNYNFNPLDDYIKKNLPPKIAMKASIDIYD